MRVFIFGAGASSGSQFHPTTKQPITPITDDLFDNKYGSIAEKVGLSKSDLIVFKNSFKRSKDKSLETWLTKLWENMQKTRAPQARKHTQKKIASITYFLWLLLQTQSREYNNQTNIYKKLLDKLFTKKSPFGMINFNYDTLLDRAYIKTTAASLSTFEDYIDNNYIKPHGSINWWIKKRATDPNDNSPSNQANVRLNFATAYMFEPSPIDINGMAIFPPNHDHLNNLSTMLNNTTLGWDYGYPVILIPTKSKIYSHFTGFKTKIIEPGIKLLKKADEVYIIGYQASDEIIKELFTSVKQGTKLHVISKGDAKKIQSKIIKLQKKFVRGQINDNGFADFVDTLKI